MAPASSLLAKGIFGLRCTASVQTEMASSLRPSCQRDSPFSWRARIKSSRSSKASSRLRPRLLVTTQTIQNRAAIIEAQSFGLSFLVVCCLAEQLDGLFRIAREIFKPGQLRERVAI